MEKSLFRFILLLTFALVPGLMANARAEMELVFNLANDTGHDIREIYIGSSTQREWGSNILKAVLKDGQTREVTFNSKVMAEKWDIKAVYTDDETAEWRAAKLTTIFKLALHWDKDKGFSTTAE